jgi:hypothetical protein
LLVHDVPSLFYRSRIDMTIPWIFTNYALLIPVAGDTANINAAIKPFQWPVYAHYVYAIIIDFKNNNLGTILFKGLVGTWNIHCLRDGCFNFISVLLSPSSTYNVGL